MRMPDGKVAVITGASSGIGAAVAREFARRGARVVLLGRRVERLQALSEQLGTPSRALAMACDVTDRAALDAAMAQAAEAFGSVDFVLANAGFGVSGALHRLDTPDFRRQFDTNVFGVIDTAYAALPFLEKSGGVLGIVSSVMGHIGLPASAPYCASKFAVAGFAEAIYYELQERGVAVTLISPGVVASEIRSVDNAGVYTGKPDPAPKFLIMPVEEAARQMVDALARRKPAVIITRHGRFVVFMKRHFPRTTRAIIRRMSCGRLGQIEAAKRGKPSMG